MRLPILWPLISMYKLVMKVNFKSILSVNRKLSFFMLAPCHHYYLCKYFLAFTVVTRDHQSGLIRNAMFPREACRLPKQCVTPLTYQDCCKIVPCRFVFIFVLIASGLRSTRCSSVSVFVTFCRLLKYLR